MDLCAKLSDRVLALENKNTSQAAEIATLKERVQKLEKKRRSIIYKPKRLYKVGLSKRIESSDEASLGAQEDASKQGRKIADLDADAEVTLIDETRERNDEEMFAGDPVTAANVEVTTASAPTTTIDELTLDHTLIEIKAAKPKAVTTAATTTTTTKLKARGVVVQEPSEFKTTTSPSQASRLPQAKDKGKAIVVEPKKPLKKKDQITLDEEVARNLEAQLQAELEEEKRLARQKEEEATIALIESRDNTQAMIEADRLLAERLQTREQEEFSIKKKSRLFIEFMEKRKKHFAALRAKEKRNKPPTKAQKKSTMSTYLKHMGGYKHKGSKKAKIDAAQESSSKRAEEAEIKKYMEIVQDEEVAIDAIPLATKPPVIIKYKIVKEGKIRHFQLIRADRSSKMYSSMIKMLQGIDREDLETLWKLVKAKHGLNRPVEEYERVLWGDLKVIFKPDIKSKVWRNLQGYKVPTRKLFDSCRVHFVRFKDLHIFMLVEKRYPVTICLLMSIFNSYSVLIFLVK
ncbi:hypothetical protein Tco_0400598 [Tanacetum coccineum]